MKSVYFAHPLQTYGTKEALAVWQALKRTYRNCEVIDPEEFDSPGPWKSCRECMDETMKPIFFAAIDRCEKVAIWAPLDTCGVKCEANYAWLRGKELLHVDTSDPSFEEIDFEPITLQEFSYLLQEAE